MKALTLKVTLAILILGLPVLISVKVGGGLLENLSVAVSYITVALLGLLAFSDYRGGKGYSAL